MQCSAFAQRHSNKFTLGGLSGLSNSLRNLTRFAVTDTDAALLIAYNNKGGKSKTPATLNYFGYPIDMNQSVDKFVVAFVTLIRSCHFTSSLKIKTGFPSCFSKGFNAAVIEIAAAVENNILDARL